MGHSFSERATRRITRSAIPTEEEETAKKHLTGGLVDKLFARVQRRRSGFTVLWQMNRLSSNQERTRMREKGGGFVCNDNLALDGSLFPVYSYEYSKWGQESERESKTLLVARRIGAFNQTGALIWQKY
jgi:hypothetical protein